MFQRYSFLLFIRLGIALSAFIGLALSANGQSSYLPSGNKEYNHLADRMDIRFNKYNLKTHTTVKPYERRMIAALCDSIVQDSMHKLSRADRFNLQYIANDNSEWTKAGNSLSKRPILKYFYKYTADLVRVDTKDFDLHLNPVLYFSYGRDAGTAGNLYTNTRGLEMRGMINRRIGFYTFIADNQALLPEYVKTYSHFATVLGVPGEGYTKPFKVNGVDFITARGYFSFNIIPNIQLQFGHDKNFIGNGYRSLVLSDYSSNYTFLKINTRVWKINYLNLFAEMNADVYYLNKLLPKKYFALHHLNFQATKNLSFGLFESVVFGRRDTTRHGQFDFNYLNPIIFYRSIEQQLGSQDNAMLGADAKLNFAKHLSLYGQLILDEFVLQQVLADSGWSGNKQAGQIGIKYIDAAGISNLDVQLEANIVRPYMYSHKDKYRSYSNFNQSLAHPLGSNFYESIAIVRYQPLPRLSLRTMFIYTKYGSDTTFNKSGRDNLGGNIFKNYETAPKAFGNNIAQGIPVNLMYTSITASYQLRHNLFIDLAYVNRKWKSGLATQNLNTNFTSVSLRLNIAQRLHEF